MGKKEGKLYTLFMDLRAVFDKIVRKKVWETMEKTGTRYARERKE